MPTSWTVCACASSAADRLPVQCAILLRNEPLRAAVVPGEQEQEEAVCASSAADRLPVQCAILSRDEPLRAAGLEYMVLEEHE